MITNEKIVAEDQNFYEIENEEEFNFYLTILQNICKKNNTQFICYHSNNLRPAHYDYTPTYDFIVVPVSDPTNLIVEADLSKGLNYTNFRDYFEVENNITINQAADSWLQEEHIKYKEYKKNPIRKWFCLHPNYQDNNFNLNSKVSEVVSSKIRNFIITKAICEDKPIYNSILKVSTKELIKIICDYKNTELVVVKENEIQNYNDQYENFAKNHGADLFCLQDVTESDTSDLRRYNPKTKMWDMKIKCKKCNKTLSKKNCKGYYKLDLCIKCDEENINCTSTLS